MKKFNLIAWIIFLGGILLKSTHIPGANMIMVLGVLLLLIHCIIYFMKNVSKDFLSSIFHFSSLFWSIYLFFRIQYLSYSGLIFTISLLTTFTYLILHIIKKKKYRLPHIAFTLYVGLSLFVFFTSTHQIYYVFNYSILNGQTENIYYEKWDKYSWFLYSAGKKDEAIEANLNAQKSLKNAKNTISRDEQQEYSEMLQKHEIHIIENNWVDYP